MVRRQFERGLSLVTLVLAGVALSLVLGGCLTSGSGTDGNTSVVADPSAPLPPHTTPERAICDPFGNGSSAWDRGLIGTLVFLMNDQPKYQTAREYIEHGYPVESTLYFDRVFVPTRRFDRPFITLDGQEVLNHNGEAQYEYFGVRLESQLQLAEDEPAGWYQLAILSDDGANLYQRDTDTNELTLLVANDGDHPTRMGCGNGAIYLEPGVRIPIVLEYYQGPKYHIAMTLMWRRLTSEEDPLNPPEDVQCGKSGNEMYFDYDKEPSEPTPTFYGLLERGWKPLENANYRFPAQASNPCASENPLLLSNFAIQAMTRTSVTVVWNSNQPSTSKAQVKNVLTGEIISSIEDTALKTSHNVEITGLTANTIYAIQGMSSIPGSQPSVTNELVFRTPR